MGMDKFDSWIRKIDPMKYIHTKLDDDFSSTQETYKVVRDQLKDLEKHFYHIMTYEFGGKTWRDATTKLNDLTKEYTPKIFDDKSLYLKISESADRTSKIKTNKKLSLIAKDYRDTFDKLNVTKNSLNEKLQSLLFHIQDLKSLSKMVDKKRSLVKDAMYRLEKAEQKTTTEPETKKLLAKDFVDKTNEALNCMREFLESEKTIYIFKKSKQDLKEYYMSCSDVFNKN